MELKINGEVKVFIFGIRFVRELDKKFFIENNGMKFGTGLSTKLIEIHSGSIVALADVLHCATSTEAKRPALEDIESYLESCDKIEKVFEETLAEIESNNAGKLIARDTKKAMKTK